MRRRNVRVSQWNRYVERLPRLSRTPSGYFRQSHSDVVLGVEMPDGDRVGPALEAAMREAEQSGQRQRRFEVRFTALKQGRRR